MKKDKHKKHEEVNEAMEEVTKDAVSDEAAAEDIAKEENGQVTLDKAEYDALAQSAKQVEELQDKLLRTQAEFENTRKRLSKDALDSIENANRNIVNSLLMVLDNFERAIANAKASEEHAGMLEGVEMIYKQLVSILEGVGLARIEAKGQSFDPYKHEAILHEENADVPPDTVTEEIQTGYVFNDKLLRPAVVKVSKAPEDNKDN